MALRVNGEIISDERFYREFLSVSGGLTPEQLQQQSQQDFLQAQQTTERNVLRSVLLQQLARQEGLTVTPQEVEDERRSEWGSAANQMGGAGIAEEMAASALVRKAERHVTRHVPRPNRQEVEEIYRGNAAMFQLPDRWLVSHIVCIAETNAERAEAREKLTQAMEELQRGKSFAAVADRYSDCKGNGGALGWIGRGSMAAEFEAKVFALPKHMPSDIFATPFGLHIALVQDQKAAGTQPLDEIRTELARRIYEDRRQSVVEQTLNMLLQQSQIEVVQEPERSVASGEKVQ